MSGYGEGLYGDGPYGGGSTLGVPLLPGVLDGVLVVEIAWGADITTEEALWEWTDITEDVRTENGIETSLGRADEASTSQPASCSFTVDNSTGKYSLGPDSPNYPNVRRNAPVRVIADAGDGVMRLAFQGFATGFEPSWQDARGSAPDVKLTASGVLRRLLQGSSQVLSSLRRGLTDQPDTVSYWPCEEGKSATVITPVVGTQPLIVNGAPKFTASTVFDCSGPLPELNGAILNGVVENYEDTGESQVRVLFAFPDDDAGPDETCLYRVFTSGTASRWDMIYRVGGNFRLDVFDRFGTRIYTSSTFVFGVNGSGRFYSLELTQSGPDISWTVGTLQPYKILGDISGTVVGRTAGIVTRVTINPERQLTDTGVGHVVVQNAVTNRYDLQDELDAKNGEYTIAATDGRLERLCIENGVPYSALGAGEGLGSPADRMGPQLVDTLLNLLRECEFADQGVLYDGVSAGLRYTTRRLRENRTPELIIDAAAGQLALGFQPTDDDQRNRNRVEVTRANGASSVFEDTDGPLGTSTIGVYDTSETVNTWQDSTTYLYAGWLVSLGTVEGYRFPTLNVDLGANPELAAGWLAVKPGSRIDILNVDQVLPGFPTGAVSLIVEGVSQSFGARTWTGTANCSPYDPYRIIVLSEDTADTDEYLCHLDTDLSIVDADVPAGVTQFPVQVIEGPLWTTDPDDFPFTISVYGRLVTVLGISGSVSPQTFTVEATDRPLDFGFPVNIHRPTRLGL